MNREFLNNQVVEAKKNSNYFLSRIVFLLLFTLVKVILIVFIGIIVSNPILIGIELLYTIYLLYDVIGSINYYFDIIRDINDTLKSMDSSVDMDFKEVRKLVLSTAIK